MIRSKHRWLIALALAPCCGSVAQQPWTLVGIGDTQVLSQTVAGGQAIESMTQWVVDNQQAENIVFVTQLGDIVQDGLYGRANAQASSVNNVDEWNRVESAVALLEDASIPWGTAVGNHELDWVDVIPGATPSSNWWSSENPGIPVPPSGFEGWKQRFGPTTTGRFDDVPQFGGASPDDVDSYFVYNAGGRDYLHIHLQVDVPDTAISWAQGVIDAYPGMPTIVSTHVFEGTIHGPPNHPYLSGPGRNSANQVWDKLIKDNDQIFLVLNGHTGQQQQRTRTNAAGNSVFTIVQDYAGFDTSGQNSGYMRLYEFDEANSVMRVRTYSPKLDEYLTTASHQYDLTLDWLTRFDITLVGDLDFNTVIDVNDWNLFRTGHLEDLSSLTRMQQYAMGDMDGDGDNDINDFGLFKSAYDNAHGVGQFEVMVSRIPEPCSSSLLGACTCSSLLVLRGRLGRCRLIRQQGRHR